MLKKEFINQRKIASANRSQLRQFEQANLQLNSNQPITKLQKSLDSQHFAQLFTNVNCPHYQNHIDHKWNQLDNVNEKQLEYIYLPLSLKNEEWAYNNVKQKIVAERQKQSDNLQQQKQRISKIDEEFQRKRDKNQQIYNRLKLVRQKSPIKPTKITSEPLFVRLSEPKCQYIPENTYDLPDFRGFTLSNFTHIDRVKNSQLLTHYASTNLIPRITNKNVMNKQFITEKPIKEDIQTTIQIDEQNIDDNFKEEAINEIDEFQYKLENHQQLMYSQVKSYQQKLTTNMSQFKELRKKRKELEKLNKNQQQ